MKYILLIFVFAVATYTNAQQTTGSIVGKLTDREQNDEPLAFANVLIKGTTTGTTSDFDGLYEISGLEPGTYIVVYSYLGYETVEIPNVTVEAGKVTSVNVPMSASSGFALDEVVITTVARKDSEVALLLDQKNAVIVVESIGAQELGDLGITDVQTAATKISGVTESEASGNIFVRGLGDRYLSTTLNGLPIPSDDVEKKNISLGLFPTRVIQNVSISKTYSALNSADQASGTINIASRELVGQTEFSVGVKGGFNTNVMEDGIRDNFLTSPNMDDTSLGFYKSKRPLLDQITQQGWDPIVKDNPYDFGVNLAYGTKLFDNKLSFILTASHDETFSYNQGVFQFLEFGFVQIASSDYTIYQSKINNSALLDLSWYINDKNKIKSTTTFLNTLNDFVVEQGRNGEARISDDTGDNRDSEFVRDQNIKQTRLWVTQLLGEHSIGEKNKLDWAIGYNVLNADEPNRIRNQLFFDEGPADVVLNSQGGFSQRKASQLIEDIEYNGYIKDAISIIKEEDEDGNISKAFEINVGGAYRNKERDFGSEFIGVTEVGRFEISANSLDNVNNLINQANLDNDLIEINRLGENENGERKDIYTGEYTSKSAFSDFNLELGKWGINAGLRYQLDNINVLYDVGNDGGAGRQGEVDQEYQNLYPSLNVKYEINDKNALRFAASRTITLPEFKEIAPFEYVSPNGLVVVGNAENLVASFTNNFDLKWEFFPTSDQLISTAVFYKDITDPINRTLAKGGENRLTFDNTGEDAKVYGIEVESKISLLKSSFNETLGKDTGVNLDLVLNATRMWHEQDLKLERNEEGDIIEFFRFGTSKSTGLEGAADFILNTNLNFKTAGENRFSASANANYASDKIYVVGNPDGFNNYDYSYNDNIVENGFMVLNARISKIFAKKWEIYFSGTNLLDPTIRQTQNVLDNFNEVRNFSTDIEERLGPDAPTRIYREETVREYKLGRRFAVGLTFTL